MLDQAARLLAEAKKLHDQLEDYYVDAMDFDKVNAVCERVIARYDHILSQYGL